VEAPPCPAGSAFAQYIICWSDGFWRQVQGALFLAVLCVTTGVIPEGSRKELSLQKTVHASSIERFLSRYHIGTGSELAIESSSLSMVGIRQQGPGLTVGAAPLIHPI
jgi:hypothetical protein